jgi:hypothetical protein
MDQTGATCTVERRRLQRCNCKSSCLPFYFKKVALSLQSDMRMSCVSLVVKILAILLTTNRIVIDYARHDVTTL